MWLGFFSRGDAISIFADSTENRKAAEITKPGRIRIYNSNGTLVFRDRVPASPASGLIRNVFFYILSTSLTPGYYFGFIDYVINNNNYLKPFRFKIIPTDSDRGVILSHHFVSRDSGTTIIRKCDNNVRVAGREITL